MADTLKLYSIPQDGFVNEKEDIIIADSSQ